MTRNEYEQRKQRLEQQLRSGIELLESAYRVQVRALDLVWMLQAEEASAGLVLDAPTPAKQEPLPAANASRRRRPDEVIADLNKAFWHLPGMFTRGDVCKALGYEPERGGLYRILQGMVKDGLVAVESLGEGKRATVYRKIEPADSPQDA